MSKSKVVSPSAIDFSAGVEDDEGVPPPVQEMVILSPDALLEPELPGFAMADEITELPSSSPGGYSELINQLAGDHDTMLDAVNGMSRAGASASGASMAEAAVKNVVDGQVIPPPPAGSAPGSRAVKKKPVSRGVSSEGPVSDGPAKVTTYESRIRIMDAWQYPGNLAEAPVWVDRNWVGYADPDSLRGFPAGPVIRVPTYADESVVIITRPGDYICRQEVFLNDDSSFVQVEVWEKEQFEKLFIKIAEAVS